jgi:hypothetical protein
LKQHHAVDFRKNTVSELESQKIPKNPLTKKNFEKSEKNLPKTLKKQKSIVFFTLIKIHINKK